MSRNPVKRPRNLYCTFPVVHYGNRYTTIQHGSTAIHTSPKNFKKVTYYTSYVQRHSWYIPCVSNSRRGTFPKHIGCSVNVHNLKSTKIKKGATVTQRNFGMCCSLYDQKMSPHGISSKQGSHDTHIKVSRYHLRVAVTCIC